MDAVTAIMELYQSGEIARACRAVSQNHQLHEDLAQETVMVLLEKPADKIMSLHVNGALRFYAVRIIMVLWRGKWSQFTAKYRHFEPVVEFDQNIQARETDYNCQIDELMAIVEAEMESWAKDGAYPYDKNLLIEVVEAGSMTAISKATKIPYRSIVWSVEKAKTKIKKRLKDHGFDSIGYSD